MCISHNRIPHCDRHGLSTALSGEFDTRCSVCSICPIAIYQNVIGRSIVADEVVGCDVR